MNEQDDRAAIESLLAGTEDARAYKLLRVLRREESGWKVHRAIWNERGEGGSP